MRDPEASSKTGQRANYCITILVPDALVPVFHKKRRIMRSQTFDQEDYPIVLFDSQCLICDGFVKRVIKWDKEGVLKFSGLQSDKAVHEINRRNIPMPKNGSVVLLFEDRYATESDAVIKILEITGKSSFFIRLIRGIPKSWRDVAYRWVAKNRYRFYKKRDHCPLPEPSETGRFV